MTTNHIILTYFIAAKVRHKGRNITKGVCVIYLMVVQ